MSRIEARALGSILGEALPDPGEIAAVASVATRDAAALRLEPIEGGAAGRIAVALAPPIDARALASVAALGGRARELPAVVPPELHGSLHRVVFMADVAATLEALRHEARDRARGPVRG